MKKPILYFVLLLSSSFLFAWGSLTFDPNVPDVNNGIVDFTFDLVGGGAEYDLSVEVSFENGDNWADIPAGAINSDVNNVAPATGIAFQWDAMASFPGQVTDDARLRVTARHVCGTIFTFTYPAGGTVTVTYGTIERGGFCWFDRNLGAEPMLFVPADDATGNTDTRLYGDLFQWGRAADGHQIRGSGTTSILSNSDSPGHGDFILAPNDPYDWLSQQNNNLWQGVGGTNNPCPTGCRIPAATEWDAERASWTNQSSIGAFNSPLKLPAAGRRSGNNGDLFDAGSIGYYWSSTVDGVYSKFLRFSSDEASMLNATPCERVLCAVRQG